MRLDDAGGGIVLQGNLAARAQLLGGKHAMARKQRLDGLSQKQIDGIHRVVNDRQSAPAGFRSPGRIVVVSVENHAAVRAVQLGGQRSPGPVHILRSLQPVRNAPKLLRRDGVEHGIRHAQRLRGAHHAKLELVARKGEGGGAVAVGVVLSDVRQRRYADVHKLGLRAVKIAARGQMFKLLRQMRAEEYRDDLRRRFVPPQSALVAAAGAGHAQRAGIFVHRRENRQQKGIENAAACLVLAGLEQVFAAVRGERPVVVLAAAVDVLEGLFVQQAGHAVALGNAPHHLHHQLVLIHRQIGGDEELRQLVLGGRDLVVLGLAGYAHAPERGVQFMHKADHPLRRRRIVLVRQLLALGWLGAKERPARIDQILPLQKGPLVDKKILLLRAHRRRNALGPVVPQCAQHAQRLLVERLHGAQQRRFFIQRFAGKGAEGRGDAEAARSVRIAL